MSDDEAKRIEEARRAWEARTRKPVGGKPAERPGLFATSGGAPVEPLYTPADVAGLDYLRDLGFPFELPVVHILSVASRPGSEKWPLG